jgi:hypothetical protein
MTRAAALLLALTAACAHEQRVAKRPLPDYDGRGAAPTTAGDVLLWVPRVVVAPLWLVSEYVVRRPMGWLIVTGERNQWPARVLDFFDLPIGVVPTFYVDLGLRAHAGLYFFWNDFLAHGNDLRLTASAGLGNLSATLADRVHLGAARLTLRGHASRRSDGLFFGIGPESRAGDRSRYQVRRLETSLALDARLARFNFVRVEGGFADVRYDNGGCCGTTLAERIEAGELPSPPGFAAGGHGGLFARARLTLDSRPSELATGVGLVVDADVDSDLASGDAWMRLGGTLAATLDVDGRQRVLGLQLDMRLAAPLRGDEVPFDELVTVGGSGPLPGFLEPRLRDRSAIVATLRYEWPIWVYLSGVAHVALGNVFGERFAGFDTQLLRLSTGLGIRSVGLGDHRFELLVALGTEPLGRGGDVDSVRFLFGSVTAF